MEKNDILLIIFFIIMVISLAIQAILTIKEIMTLNKSVKQSKEELKFSNLMKECMSSMRDLSNMSYSYVFALFEVLKNKKMLNDKDLFDFNKIQSRVYKSLEEDDKCKDINH